VRAALRSDGPPKYEREPKGSVADGFEPRIRELLAAYPTMPASVDRIGWPYADRTLRTRVAFALGACWRDLPRWPRCGDLVAAAGTRVPRICWLSRPGLGTDRPVVTSGRPAPCVQTACRTGERGLTHHATGLRRRLGEANVICHGTTHRRGGHPGRGQRWPGYPLTAITLLASLTDQAGRMIPDLAADARRNHASWADIATALGTSPD